MLETVAVSASELVPVMVNSIACTKSVRETTAPSTISAIFFSSSCVTVIVGSTEPSEVKKTLFMFHVSHNNSYVSPGKLPHVGAQTFPISNKVTLT